MEFFILVVVVIGVLKIDHAIGKIAADVKYIRERLTPGKPPDDF
jgi:hypothetical protein